MPKTGLRKATIDVPLKGSLMEKVSPELAPPEGMYRLENVELDKLGEFRRRRGFEIMSTVSLGPGGPAAFGLPRKVAGRDSELFALAETRTYLGSGGGSGNAGTLVWSYSPEQTAWRAHGKVSGLTVERAFGIVNGQTLPKWTGIAFVTDPFSAFEDKRHVVMAYTQGSWDTQSIGVHALVWDVTSRATILEDTVIDALDAAGAFKLEVVQLGRFAVILYRRVIDTAVDFKVVVYDCANPSLGFSSPFTLFAASFRGARGWTAAADGTHLYLLTLDNAGTLRVDKYTVDLSAIIGVASNATFATTSAPAAGNPGMHIVGGRVHIAWSGAGAVARYASLASSDLASVAAAIAVSSLATTGNVYVVGVSASEACVVWSDNPLMTMLNMDVIY